MKHLNEQKFTYPRKIRKAEFFLVESQKEKTELQIGLATEASPEHPLVNEDSYYVSEDRGLMMVADGVGGGIGGDLASRQATQELTRLNLTKRDDAIRRVMDADREKPLNTQIVEDAVNATLENMQRSILEMQKTPEVIQLAVRTALTQYGQRLDPNNPKDRQKVLNLAESMSCTATLAKTWMGQNGKSFITFGNVGDSRAYRLRKGRLERMTSDHSLVQALVDERVRDTRSEIIEDDQDITRSVGMSELKKHQKNPLIKQIIHLLDAENKTEVTIDEIRRYVTETLGKHFNKTEKLTPDIRTEELHHDDIILLCTDGLSDVLTDDEIRAIIERHKENMLDAAQSLIKAAANRSTTSHLRAKPDDITAIVQRFKTT